MDSYRNQKHKWWGTVVTEELTASLLAEIADRGASTARDLDDGLPTSKENWGWNWSATAEISERRPDLRKARRKPTLFLRALAKRRHLENMMDHEKMLASSKMMRTAKATGPELRTISTMALPDCAVMGGAAESS